MIGRALRFEVAGLTRSPAIPITVLFAVGGAIFGRTVTWLSSLLHASEIEELLWLDTAGSEIAVPLALLAYVIATAYVFGRDLADGTADVALTSPIRRDSILVAKWIVLLVWVLSLAGLGAASDAIMRALLSLSSVSPGATLPLAGTLAATLAGFAAMPLLGWAALRFRGMIASVGAGIALYVGSFALRGLSWASALPWNAPFGFAVGDWSMAPLAGLVLVLAAGIVASLWQVRRLDLL